MNIYDNLSEDDHVAFLELEKEFRNEMELAQEIGDLNWVYVRARYMNYTLAAATTLGIDVLTSFSVNTRDSYGFDANFDEFLRAVHNVTVQIRIANSRTRNAMSVGLTVAQKEKIHHFIGKIREEVDVSTAAIQKKERLYDILEALGKEVSKSRTRYERFADLARSLAGLSADLEREGARPWWPWFEKIMGLLDDAKEAEPKLPKPPEIKKIEPPHKELPKPDGGYGNEERDLGDEIPF